MQKMILYLALLLLTMQTAAAPKSIYCIGNEKITREVGVKDGLKTITVTNALMNKRIKPIRCDEFQLRLSAGTDKEGTDRILTAADFKVKDVEEREEGDVQHLTVSLRNKAEGLNVWVHYEIKSSDHYMRKWLEIETEHPVTLERVDVEHIAVEESFQTYNIRAITSYLKGEGYWKPGLGMPLYTSTTATFWGVEFPAATNTVVNHQLSAGYLWGKQLTPGERYMSHKAVVGVSDDPAYIDEAFMNYIDDIRIRPLRLQIQYNCFFDFGWGVDKNKFAQSVKKINDELVVKRGVEPLASYVIDDGWEDGAMPDFDKPAGVWSINKKFSPDFQEEHSLMKSVGASLGLWLSPGCFFGSKQQVKVMREKNYEALTLSMSMAGPQYMQKLENRILELTRQGVGYFKYDGLFGHQYTRDYELNGRGVPTMSQLDTEGFTANDVRLNNPMYDELKLYYLTAGTERLIQIFKRQHEVNPNVFTAITNGAFLSPWWLMYVDVVWLINCGDAAGGTTRNAELTYRDGVYFEVFQTENTKFPINSIFNHEPKKTSTGEACEVFRDYLFMSLSRGAGFVELYLKTKALSESDWDILAEGLKWVRKVFPAFRRVIMVGGNPRENVPYGYSGWTVGQGYLSLHNPGAEIREIRVKLDRSIGMQKSDKVYRLTSPIAGDTDGLVATYRYGDEIVLKLQPKEIRILEFE